MKILFDHCTPAPLRRYLSGHSIDTAYELGWNALRNGALFNLVEQRGYEILITKEQGIRCQQNMTDRKISLLLLFSNSWPRIRLHIEAIQDALKEILPGELREVPIPSPSEYHRS